MKQVYQKGNRMTTASTKIVIVAGQEFSVPADTPNEAIRTQLTSMGFADVAAATIQTGTRTIDGVETPTIEFVKKAGTKGLDAAGLAALLERVPPTNAVPHVAGLTRAQTRLLARLMSGDLTCDQALAAQDDLRTLLDTVAAHEGGYATREGGRLCQQIDALPAVAAAAPSAW